MAKTAGEAAATPDSDWIQIKEIKEVGQRKERQRLVAVVAAIVTRGS